MEEMRQLISGYQSSLTWLDAFTTNSAPQSLTSGSWGKDSQLEGSEVKPSGDTTSNSLQEQACAVELLFM